MRIETRDIIQEYSNSIKDEYPELSNEGIRDICIAPWVYLKDCMESGALENIRLKYFGVFYVCPARAKRMLEEAKDRFSKQLLTPKQFFKIKSNIETYLKNLKEDEEED